MVGSLCEYQGVKKDFKDSAGRKQIYCTKHECLCIGQRFCPDLQQWIVSERAKNICKDYKNL